MSPSSTIESLILQLHELSTFKFGDFKLKSGISSPVYIDLTSTSSRPSMGPEISEALISAVSSAARVEYVCGADPHTALIIASSVSRNTGISMLSAYDFEEEDGTITEIQGVIRPSKTCLIIADVVTSGATVLETAAKLRAVGIVVTDAVVMIDREQGGCENLRENGIKLHAVIKLRDVMRVLRERGKIEEETERVVIKYLEENPKVGVCGGSSSANP